jgi:glyoxylase-like metal-dependent hydrolase (beta-lactamase superfamily II)
VIEPVDLVFHGTEHVIGVYVVDTPEGPALFDCGPATTFERLQEVVDLSELRHLLVSHIHLDHSGAAGHVVQANPNIQVHVSEIGAPHLVDPSRLLSSARRLYGDALDQLYGEPLPVPAENVHAIWDTAAGLKSFPTPGHASHHVSYLDDAGTLLAGDAAGVRIVPGRHVLPQAPPPDIDIEAWERTFDAILVHQPARLALIHYGVVEGTEEVASHIAETRERLAVWSQRVQDGMTEDEFVAAAKKDLRAEESASDAAHYEQAAPIEQSFLGLERYWRKKGERDAETAASA